MLMMLTAVPGDIFSLELGSGSRYVTGALLLISVIEIITFAYDASVQKTHGPVESSAPAGCCDRSLTLYFCLISFSLARVTLISVF